MDEKEKGEDINKTEKKADLIIQIDYSSVVPSERNCHDPA
jgi:hypothetical protein